MNQSKMSISEKKEFTMKHVFRNVDKMKVSDVMCGPIEMHRNIPWQIRIFKNKQHVNMYLDCLVDSESSDWFIDAHIVRKVQRKFGEPLSHTYFMKFYQNHAPRQLFWLHAKDYKFFLVNGNFTVTLTIEVGKVIGIPEKKKLKSFDDEVAKKFSDVVLLVKNQEFHVNKKYLASHSTYFDALFFGKFAESQKSEIKLKDIDPDNFQDYLEFIHAESSIKADTVFGILHLADFFDSKTVIRRCQEFLIYDSELPLKQKFEVAIKHNFEELKTKCLSEVKTIADLKSISPEEGVSYGEDIMIELFKKSLKMH